MLSTIRQKFVENLWCHYKKTNPQANTITHALRQNGSKIVLDHFAVVDLPSPHSGISVLTQILSSLGYLAQDHGYLPDKQNEFLWLAEIDATEKPAESVLPQIVVADFWLDELTPDIKKIIEKYTRHIPAPPLREIQRLAGKVFLEEDDPITTSRLLEILTQYFLSKEWPTPTIHDFKTVQEENELLAWILAFGRSPNHFTISAHLTTNFDNFQTFSHFISEDLGFDMNKNGGGIIKGSPEVGIEQASTLGIPREVTLADGTIILPEQFMEFVWRYPKNPQKQEAVSWKDYYTGFIPHQANHVIESLYNAKNS